MNLGCLPLKKNIGTELLLFGLVETSVMGAVVTWFFRIETTGLNLEKIGHEH
ncbi:MAG TPA: hypothetical protein PK874_14955 [Desulfobacteraceae bacterium]|nr:hypothetical protein [Desulfobacteraceae bacterium]HPJ67947.1 hypothetical protein [Desulfobacteraceae bacterium]HPQ28307.1 hypothetical protein [Desulfobacteraceae bacterium]